MQFLHSVLVNNESITAGDIKTDDLPVNPLSHILLTVRFAQNLANTQATFANVLAMLSKIEVLYKGGSVYSLNGSDAYAVARYIQGFESWGINQNGDDNELRSFTWLIPFGRYVYNPLQCYPASKRGELILQTTFASAFTNIDGVSYQVETVQLPDAAPETYTRVTTLSKTPTATGEDKIDLPIGNLLSDVVLWGTTIPTASTATKTINSVELEINEVERYYSRTLYETLHNMAGILGPLPAAWGNHIHQIDGAAFAQYMDTSAVKQNDHTLSNYLWLPIDVNGNGVFAIDTKGLSKLQLVLDFGDTNAMRCLPVEVCSTAERS